jgi:hypothetical protein
MFDIVHSAFDILHLNVTRMKRIKQMITDCQEENSCKSVISVLSVFYNECRLPGIINGDWEFRIVF